MKDASQAPAPGLPHDDGVEVLPPPGAGQESPQGQARRMARHEAPSVWGRVFAIGWIGWVRLAAAALVIGLIVRAAELNPFAPGFNLPEALGDVVTAIAGMFAWALANGWAPFLVGALIVMPVFILWRLVAMPFRSKGPPTLQAPRQGPRWGR